MGERNFEKVSNNFGQLEVFPNYFPLYGEMCWMLLLDTENIIEVFYKFLTGTDTNGRIHRE